MIELAPTHKYGLVLPTPMMPAAGAFGYGDAYRDIIESGALGALVTHPLSLRARKAARGERLAVHGNHFVVHTGWPNPGVKRAIRRYRKYWEQSPVPVIPHLMATSPRETGRAAAQLSTVHGVGALELGLAENVPADKALTLLDAAQQGGGLPVIARVPFSRVDTLAPLLAEHGADALTLTAPPRAVLPLPTPQGKAARFIRGRLYGRALLPLLLNTLSRWTTPGGNKLPIPVIACGGIASTEDALACIRLGAAAVQVDALIWQNPELLVQIAHGIQAYTHAQTGG